MSTRSKRRKNLGKVKAISKHPHICSGCGEQMTGCECKNSYIFAYKCPTCAGVPNEMDRAVDNIGIVRL